jgi:hypothetical protein
MLVRLVPAILVAFSLFVPLSSPCPAEEPPAPQAPPAAEGPGKLELSGARHRLEALEQKVKLARGQPFKLGPIETEGLQRIWDLSQRFPDHPELKELFERAQKAVMASKGEVMDLPTTALAYRENEKKLALMFEEIAAKDWEAFLGSLKEGGNLLERAFPAPSHKEVAFEEMKGKLVVLNNFYYPTNQFLDEGREFVWVGGALRGYYYVDIGNRAWLGAYEAVKRYRRFVNRDLPEGMGFTMVGRIAGLELLVPQAGEEKTIPAAWGWSVEPVAIRVPERTFAVPDATAELGGRFAGEERMEDIKSALYTVREVPKEVTPERLTEIFVTAIKEKNYPLFLDCIEPDYRDTPTARSLCLYHWDWHQHRFATMYCEVKVGGSKVRVTKGLDLSEDNIELKFLNPEQLEELKKRAGPTVRDAELTTQAFDEFGKQYGSPKPRFFRKKAEARWYILNYAQPF